MSFELEVLLWVMFFVVLDIPYFQYRYTNIYILYLCLYCYHIIYIMILDYIIRPRHSLALVVK